MYEVQIPILITTFLFCLLCFGNSQFSHSQPFLSSIIVQNSRILSIFSSKHLAICIWLIPEKKAESNSIGRFHIHSVPIQLTVTLRYENVGGAMDILCNFPVHNFTNFNLYFVSFDDASTNSTSICSKAI